ncbi:hypothetical protein [Sodaliphilus sp.]|uniref:hypothetical protein n=1 Tax=Sodaliphilus sp. TaxID=2815818 RepID=UPI003890F498
MIDTSNLTQLISALRAETESASISPENVGYILQSIVDFLPNLDTSGMADDVATAKANAINALGKASDALTSANNAATMAVGAQNVANAANATAEQSKTAAQAATAAVESLTALIQALQTASGEATEASAQALQGVADLLNLIGKAGGIAPLDGNGKVPGDFIPDNLANVLEFSAVLGAVTVKSGKSESKSTDDNAQVFYVESLRQFVLGVRTSVAVSSLLAELSPAIPKAPAANPAVATRLTDAQLLAVKDLADFNTLYNYYLDWADRSLYSGDDYTPLSLKAYVCTSTDTLYYYQEERAELAPMGKDFSAQIAGLTARTAATEDGLKPRLFFNGNMLAGRQGHALTLDTFLALTDGDQHSAARVTGVVITLHTDGGIENWQWQGGSWIDKASWQPFGASGSTTGNVVNVNELVPKAEGYYNRGTAAAAVPEELRASGRFITFMSGAGEWQTWQFCGMRLDDWADETAWHSTVRGVQFNDGDPVTPGRDGLVRLAYSVTVDDVLNKESNNPVGNAAVSAALEQMQSGLAAGFQFDASTNQLSLLDADGNVMNSVTIPAGGGGSDITPSAIELTIDNGLIATLKEGDTRSVDFTWRHYNITTGVDDQLGGRAELIVNGSSVESKDVVQGIGSFDVSPWLTVGTNSVRVRITADDGVVAQSAYIKITVVTLGIASSYSLATLTESGTVIPFRFTVNGSGAKVVNFTLDGEPLSTMTVTSSGATSIKDIPTAGLAHGAHALEVWAEREIADGVMLTSNRLYFDLMITRQGTGDIIIATECDRVKVTQYDTLTVPFAIYDPASITSHIEVLLDGVVLTSMDVDRNRHTVSHRSREAGTSTLTIKCGEVTRDIEVEVVPASHQITAETAALSLHLTASGRSNAASNKGEWSFTDANGNTTAAEFTDCPFDTQSGWLADGKGLVSLHLAGGAQCRIPLNIFAEDCKLEGKTIEVEFTATNCHDAEAVLIGCMSGTVGFEITAQECFMQSALRQRVSSKFKQGERVRVGFVIQRVDEQRFMLLYLDGVLSGVQQYDTSDYFVQNEPVAITMGNRLCDLDIWNVRVYNTSLGMRQMVNNYIADMDDTAVMFAKLERNDIMNDDNADAVDYEKAVQQIPCITFVGTLPKFKGDKKKDTKVIYEDRPHPECSFSCNKVQNDVQGTSSQYYPRKNWKFKFLEDITMTHSGSTAKKYALRGVDGHGNLVPQKAVKTFCLKADFAESSGTHNTGAANFIGEVLASSGILTPPQRIDPTVRTTIFGFPVLMFHQETESSPRTFIGKYNFNNDKSTADTFGFEKIAGYNDAMVNRSDYLLWQGTLAQLQGDADALEAAEGGELKYLIKSTADGTHLNHLVKYNAEQGAWQDLGELWQWDAESKAWRNRAGATIALANGLAEAKSGKMIENNAECWEFTNNGHPMCLFHASDFTSQVTGDDIADWFDSDSLPVDGEGTRHAPYWGGAFEPRYPDCEDLNADYGRGRVPAQLKRIVDWLVSLDITDTTLTEEQVAERKARFVAEAGNYFHKDMLLAYDNLREGLLAVDQGAKNMMWAFYDGLCYPIFYDNDTILTLNNEGRIQFTPYAELHDTDALGKQVFNGESSALWNLIEQTMDADKTTNYERLTAQGNFIYARALYWFNERQSDQWCETVYNEDSRYKYIDSFGVAGQGDGQAQNYLDIAQGSRAHHRKWVLNERFAYINAKRCTGSYRDSAVYLRANTEGASSVPSKVEVTVTAAQDWYFGFRFSGNAGYSSRLVRKGQQYTFSAPAGSRPNDTETYIYQADRIADLGDLSVLYPTTLVVGGCRLLESLTVGNATPGYTGKLATLTLGNHSLLKYINVVNCPTLQSSLDVSGCRSLERIEAQGSRITAVNLPTASVIRRMHLPETLVQLQFDRLPNLTYEGITLDGYAQIQTVNIVSCPRLDAVRLLGDILATAGNQLQYVRITDIDLTGDGQALIDMMNKGVKGAENRNGKPELFGTYRLTSYMDPDRLAQLQAYYEHLSIHNAQCTVIEFDETLSYDANITNLDNGTYDGDGKVGYVPSGHITRIIDSIHAYKGEFAGGKMKLRQISDEDINVLADGRTTSDLEDSSGVGHDIFVGMPRYWYKGINDHLHNKKYLCLSSEAHCPLPSYSRIERHPLAELLLAEFTSLLIENFPMGTAFDSSLLDTSSTNNVYRMNVEGMKQVRWPSINSNTVGCAFLDASGKVISTVAPLVSHAQNDFISGEYVFVAVPEGAVDFVFTAVRGLESQECIAVDSDAVEAIEPDWVEHEFALVGMYKATKDALWRLRSVSGQSPLYGTSTNGTSSYWKYDEQGDLVVGLPQSTLSMNRSYKDFSNLAKCRGAGYQLVDYEMHKDIDVLWMAFYGRRNCQAVNGNGSLYGTVTGGTNTLTSGGETFRSPKRESVSGQRPRTLCLEDWWANGREWMDSVAVNVTSFAAYFRNKCTVPTGSVADHVWHIQMPDGRERAVQGVSGSTEICRVRWGRYCDVVPSRLVSNSNYDTFFCDQQEYTASTGRVVARSGYNYYAYHGFVYVNATNDSSNSFTFSGSRLAFRGACEIVE